jgi:hypothetical protein
MTISSEVELQWSQQRIAELERTIASTRRRLAGSPQASADFVTLYQHELVELQSSVGEFLGMDVTPSAAVELGFETKDGGIGATTLSALGSVVDGLRVALTTIGERLAGGETRSVGRPFAKISRAVDLKVVGFKLGSFRLLLEYPRPAEEDQAELGDLAERSLDVLEDALAWVESGVEVPPESLRDDGLRRLALTEVRRLAPSDVSNISWVDLKRTRDGKPSLVRVTPETLHKANTVLEKALEAEPITLVGHLRAIDLDKEVFGITTTDGKKKRCIIEPQLLSDAVSYIANQQLVVARGNGGARSLRIVSLEPIREANPAKPS